MGGGDRRPRRLAGRDLAREPCSAARSRKGLVDHGIAPPNFTVSADWLPIAAAIGGGVVAALLAVLGAGRRAARVPPTHALATPRSSRGCSAPAA